MKKATNNLGQTLADGASVLRNRAIESYRIDAIILLEHVTGLDRSYILAHPEEEISNKLINVFNKLINKRADQIPVAYLTNNINFFGRNFYIDNRALVPRPETEDIITQFNNILPSLNNKHDLKVLDLGTGSGAIGITVKLEHPDLAVDLSDNDRNSLEIAKINVVNYSTSINVLHSDLFSSLDRDYDVILTNLPYVPDSISINKDATYEPGSAIYSGADGLSHYQGMFSEISSFSKKPLFIILESLKVSQSHLDKIASQCGYKLYDRNNLVSTYKLNN